MPTLDAELTRTERLKPLSATPGGELVTIDKSILLEVYQRLAEAIAAITRGNIRAGGVLIERRCTSALLETGRPGADCPQADSMR